MLMRNNWIWSNIAHHRFDRSGGESIECSRPIRHIMVFFDIKVKSKDLPDILNAMREWLDQRKINIAHFHSESDGQMVIIKVGFDTEDHNAEAFRQRFNPNGDSSGPDAP
jgi:hypothetical protein